MSTFHTSHVFRLRGISDKEFRVLTALSESTGDDDVFRATEDYLTERCEIDPMDVYNTITEMARRGVVGEVSYGMKLMPTFDNLERRKRAYEGSLLPVPNSVLGGCRGL